MPLTQRVERITEAERDQLLSPGARERSNGDRLVPPFLVALLGLAAIFCAFALIRSQAAVAVALSLVGCAALVAGGWVAFSRWTIRRRHDRWECMVREEAARGEVIVTSLETDLVIPAPCIDEDSDGALFRVEPGRFVLLREVVLSQLEGFADGRYPASLTIRWLPSGRVLSIEGGKTDAAVGPAIIDDRAELITMYLVAERTWEMPCPIIPASVFEL